MQKACIQHVRRGRLLIDFPISRRSTAGGMLWAPGPSIPSLGTAAPQMPSTCPLVRVGLHPFSLGSSNMHGSSIFYSWVILPRSKSLFSPRNKAALDLNWDHGPCDLWADTRAKADSAWTSDRHYQLPIRTDCLTCGGRWPSGRPLGVPSFFPCYPFTLKSNRLSWRTEMEKGCRAELGPTPYSLGSLPDPEFYGKRPLAGLWPAACGPSNRAGAPGIKGAVRSPLRAWRSSEEQESSPSGLLPQPLILV